MKIENVVSGALFDLMGFLTTRDEQIVLSTRDNAVPAVDALRAFAQMRKFSLDDAHVANWRAALDQPDGVLPPLPVGEYEHAEFVAVGEAAGANWRSFSEKQIDAHGRACWAMGLDVGMEHAPAAVETTLPDLARLLGAASKDGKAVKLSAIAAGTLYNALRTPAPAARDHGADMDLARRIGMLLAQKTTISPVTAGKLGVDIVHMLPRADQEPAGYIDRKDVVRLKNCRATVWPGTNEIDAVPVFLAPPDAAADKARIAELEQLAKDWEVAARTSVAVIDNIGAALNADLPTHLVTAVARKRMGRIAELEGAIDKLAACKGRFHAEANFKALIDVRGKKV